MDQYPVPQFIEEEAKMAFFLTVKQFVYLVIGGAVIFLLYVSLPFNLFIITALLVGGAIVFLGFFKMNGLPITVYMMNSLGFMVGSKSYTWKKKESLYPFKTMTRPEVRKIEEEKVLGAGKASELKRLKTKVEMRTK